MKFSLNFNCPALCKAVVTEQLNKLGIRFSFDDFGKLIVNDHLPEDLYQQMIKVLKKYDINIFETDKNSLVQDIKQAIDDMVFSEDMRVTKVSVYLSDKLNYSYSYLSNQFSDETYTSIENFIILRKIEYAKQLILQGNMSLTEIAHKLDYSSVSHLSGQFKKMTGLTPTAFARIIKKRTTTNL